MSFGLDLVLGGFIVTALTILISRYQKRAKGPEVKRVTVELTPEQYAQLQVQAEAQGVSPKVYAQTTVVGSLKTPSPVADAMDRAFEALDEAEMLGAGVLPLPNPKQRTVRLTQISRPSSPPGPHPCMHLSATVPTHLRGQCQGLCEHRMQAGRVCYWAPTTAKGCELFEAVGSIKGAPLAR